MYTNKTDNRVKESGVITLSGRRHLRMMRCCIGDSWSDQGEGHVCVWGLAESYTDFHDNNCNHK